MPGQRDRSGKVHLAYGENVAAVDSDGHVQVDVISGAASSGAASTFVRMTTLNASYGNTGSDNPSTNSSAVDVSAYRNFAFLFDLTVSSAPTDIQVYAQFSSNGTANWRALHDWKWNDLRWDDTTPGQATWQHPALLGECPTQYMRFFITMTGGSGTFIVDNAELHLKD